DKEWILYNRPRTLPIGRIEECANKKSCNDCLEEQGVSAAWTEGKTGNVLYKDYLWSSDESPISYPDWKNGAILNPLPQIWYESRITVVQPPRKLDLQHKNRLFRVLCQTI
ncbi:unnamed protein product, partial [Allacma fusca]